MDGKCLSDKITNMRVQVIEEKKKDAEEEEKEHLGRDERLTPEELALMRRAMEEMENSMKDGE